MSDNLKPVKDRSQSPPEGGKKRTIKPSPSSPSIPIESGRKKKKFTD